MFRKSILTGKSQACTDNAAVPIHEAAAPDVVPDQFSRSLKTQGDAMVQYGARLLVLREFLAALCAGMPAERRDSVESAFRRRVDDLLGMTDDRQLPETFHTTLLAEINYYLGELKRR
ncbi:hypothetical protein CupriaWKF_25125 [Cupriavidus sp. WKF15]|uniref:hypothetical protein n=1 Tax=Cupriavidus sp. WKF15 TaxID=3032282 RepID=UPI0023E0A81E|nr:hypothetical protein [Cupriavidus sp. WKF15]WER48091.1 hypothetical protein CupriaWKF_25125 [Cupriavidus sp. WKF15]